MDMNIYWLQVYVDAKLSEARAESARAALVKSIDAQRPGALALVGSALIRIGRRLRRRESARRAARLPLPGLS